MVTGTIRIHYELEKRTAVRRRREAVRGVADGQAGFLPIARKTKRLVCKASDIRWLESEM